MQSEKECHKKTRVALNGRDVTIVALEAEIESLRKQIGSQESQLKLRLKELETAVSMEKAQHNELTGYALEHCAIKIYTLVTP